MKKILYIIGIAAIVAVFSSCRREDDFTDSIFDTNVPAVDPTKATYEFDQWLYDNFVVPYNVDVKYRFDLSASDLNFQLTPADYNRSQLLAHFIRYLFYDVYTKFSGDDFMKKYGPRIFHFIGSSGYSPTTGTEVLGTASGGVKITLYNVNGALTLKIQNIIISHLQFQVPFLQRKSNSFHQHFRPPGPELPGAPQTHGITPLQPFAT